MIGNKVDGTSILEGEGADMDQRNYEVVNHIGVGTLLTIHELLYSLLFIVGFLQEDKTTGI